MLRAGIRHSLGSRRRAPEDLRPTMIVRRHLGLMMVAACVSQHGGVAFTGDARAVQMGWGRAQPSPGHETPARSLDSLNLGHVESGALPPQDSRPQPSFPSATPVIDVDGRPVTLASLAKNLPSDRLWVVRIQAAWCGTCQWHAEATRAWAANAARRFDVVDVLIANQDNEPSNAEDARQWRARAEGVSAVVAGLAEPFEALFRNPAPLPRVILVDPRSWQVHATLTNPTLEAIDAALGAATDPGRTVSGARAPLVDGLFSTDQWTLIQAMRLPDRWPSDPTNRVADSPAAAVLGAALFEETGLAPSRRSCASCHMADLLFTNGKDVAGEGIGPGKRNVPTVLLSGYARSLNWDGGADSGWAQAVLPFEEVDEMGSSRLYVAHGVFERQRRLYESVFGPMPQLADTTRFPPQGRPGSPEWASMSSDDQRTVNTVFANVGKAIAAYERSLRVAPTAFDRYAAGERSALSAEEKIGLQAFMQAGCAQCHHGPRLTNDAFHNLRFPTGRPDRQPDRGRSEGIAHLADNEFRRDSLFSDAVQPRHLPVDGPHALGAFRTPTLRGVPYTMPYGHGGGFGGLISVIEAHRTGGLPSFSRYAVGNAEPWAQGFDPQLTPRIAAFLQVLSADVVAAP